jgi:hypothetical protein
MTASTHIILQHTVTKKYLCRDNIRGIRFQWSSSPGDAFKFSDLQEVQEAIEDNLYEMAQLRGQSFYVITRTLLTIH